MDEIKISDQALDFAFRIVANAMCESANEKQMFKIICSVCDKHNLNVMHYMAAMREITKKLSGEEEPECVDD